MKHQIIFKRVQEQTSQIKNKDLILTIKDLILTDSELQGEDRVKWEGMLEDIKDGYYSYARSVWNDMDSYCKDFLGDAIKIVMNDRSTKINANRAKLQASEILAIKWYHLII